MGFFQMLEDLSALATLLPHVRSCLGLGPVTPCCAHVTNEWIRTWTWKKSNWSWQRWFYLLKVPSHMKFAARIPVDSPKWEWISVQVGCFVSNSSEASAWTLSRHLSDTVIIAFNLLTGWSRLCMHHPLHLLTMVPAASTPRAHKATKVTKLLKQPCCRLRSTRLSSDLRAQGKCLFSIFDRTFLLGLFFITHNCSGTRETNVVFSAENVEHTWWWTYFRICTAGLLTASCVGFLYYIRSSSQNWFLWTFSWPRMPFEMAWMICPTAVRSHKGKTPHDSIWCWHCLRFISTRILCGR